MNKCITCKGNVKNKIQSGQESHVKNYVTFIKGAVLPLVALCCLLTLVVPAPSAATPQAV